jgi:hypothetical protein
MFKKFLVAAVGCVVAISAFAADNKGVEKVYELTDGSKVFIFEGGEMGMENKYGRSVRMKPGTIMQTKSGERLIMIGDEVARVESLGHQRRAANQHEAK